MVLATNLSSMSASVTLANTSREMQVSIERLGTGLRIKKAQDDPAGNAIADRLRLQSSLARQGVDNANTAIAFVQIADKGLGEQSSTLDALRAKMMEGSSSSLTDSDRKIVMMSVSKLLDHIDKIASQTNFGGVHLLQESGDSSAFTKAFQIAVGDFASMNLESGIRSNVDGLSLTDLKNSAAGLSMTDGDFRSNLSVVDRALDILNSYRSKYGALQEQVESSARNLMTEEINSKNAESIIRDVDYSKETANVGKAIMQYRAGSFALTQANLSKEGVLNILV